jgi:hypothetical protein
MNKKTRRIYYIIEALSGLIFGTILGELVWIYARGHINMMIIKSFSAVFIGVVIGIAIPGYIYCKKNSKVEKFIKAIGLSIAGLFAFLLMYIGLSALVFDLIPHYISSVAMPVVLPLTGAVLGFNVALKYPIPKPPKHDPWV